MYFFVNFDDDFSLWKLRQLCLVFIRSYPVNKDFEIMDMKKCAAIPFNMRA